MTNSVSSKLSAIRKLVSKHNKSALQEGHPEYKISIGEIDFIRGAIEDCSYDGALAGGLELAGQDASEV
jgi:hypothetical protein